MLRHTPAAVAVLAFAILVVCVAAPQAAAKEEKVTVDVTCHTEDPGPGKVTVDPWLLYIDEGDTVRWKLKITHSDQNSIVVAPKSLSRWPFEQVEAAGQGDETLARGWKGEKGTDYDYNITVSCNDYEFVIDPRVRVR